MLVHFPEYSVESGNVSIDFDPNRIAEKIEEVQNWFAWRVLQDCQARMPLHTGSLRQRSYVAEEGRAVVFPGPYGRFQYGGKVMVDPVTRSPWARPGVKKVLTDRPLSYAEPAAVDHWFEVVKAEHAQEWVEELNRKMRGE